MGRRSQEDRDAMTVEIGFALVSGAVLAAAAFLAIGATSVYLDLSRTAEHVVFTSGAVVAAVVFVARLVDVLWGFPRRGRGPTARLRRQTPPQPSQPGRTSPDS
ncbi:DUF6332 family protein [Streptomyces sp. JH14]|uniref:DUF6332 family protein n=1 Tax=Streptomyces sp. JH14 TaxID=2793630 RepID=UPI0023F9AEB5|nr:DUF6332 family protein [Streptomyces sp. JH14]MDF6040744.1 DUF6332 family protein [Streptomyces sp. JH14]